ncbi:MAG: T9SS type A sorting domain-containing protein [Bacteroidales bacterium]|nr:T9SS type A sorting domain-containing protein [Bacteroidales bacterium]
MAKILEDEPLQVKVYPNPARDRIYIQGMNPHEITSLMMTDLSGKVVFKEIIIDGNSYNLELSAVPSGIYLLNIFTKDNATIKRIVVSR